MMRQVTHSFWREAYLQLCREVDQVLGKALGYPYYAADQKNFPGAVLADGVCTGDNVPESLLAEAANRLSVDMMKGHTFKSLVLDEFSNTPCTAALEVQLEKLATYFDRRARENAKRAEKLEGKLTTFTDLIEVVKSERGAYYFSGKEDSYKNAARKVRELLTPPVKEPEPEVWIVEFTTGTGWCRSGSLPGEYSTLAEANADIETICKGQTILLTSDYRVVRK